MGLRDEPHASLLVLHADGHREVHSQERMGGKKKSNDREIMLMKNTVQNVQCSFFTQCKSIKD